ncbi:putative ATPase [Planoprotostelium fungivorum]|uniref:Putative ATPase n=1 Tax=Planoprotostelium fungivorum TaxID=1890364 RepID=A0A2P6N6U6_9EUKA|nr:putative ATPase [Planoprotostelium fungivorum]
MKRDFVIISNIELEMSETFPFTKTVPLYHAGLTHQLLLTSQNVYNSWWMLFIWAENLRLLGRNSRYEPTSHAQSLTRMGSMNIPICLQHEYHGIEGLQLRLETDRARNGGDEPIVYRGVDSEGTRYIGHLYTNKKIARRFYKELEVCKMLDGPYIARMRSQYIITYVPLNLMFSIDIVKGPLSLDHIYNFAINSCRALGRIHDAGIILRSLSPANILFCRNTGRLLLTGLGEAALLQKQHRSTVSPQAGTKHCLWSSPEQTGRMVIDVLPIRSLTFSLQNRDVDYRTDYYSLGAVLYWLLCGRPPFTISECGDALKVMYNHTSIPPIPPSARDVRVPQPISQIVLKLLQKSADDRYQSTHGIIQDILYVQGHPNEIDFTPGGQDVDSIFRIHQKLYGREEQTERLMKAYDDVAEGRLACQLLFVRGYSGIGKTSLIRELHRPIIRNHGLFTSGKIDQFTRGIPYGSIVQCFQRLVKSILTEPEHRVEKWRETLQKAVGERGQVVIDVIPEVSLIIGPQPAVPVMGSQETEERFKQVMLEFVGAFATAEHPLVIFLDDLQWADLPTMGLLKALCSSSITHLLLIGAYRDNEVDNAHPLSMMLKTLTNVRIENIILSPLSIHHTCQLIADSTKSSVESVRGLGDIVQKKTMGNPFFVGMFLTNLYLDNLLYFKSDDGRWLWNLPKIQEVTVTDNVGDVMSRRIRDLKGKTRAVLSLAAIIGNRFDLNLLSNLFGEDIYNTAKALWPTLQEGLILLYGEEISMVSTTPQLQGDVKNLHFSFLHDQVQKAASLITEAEQRKAVHLKIGILLMSQGNDQLFETLGHFLAAEELLYKYRDITMVARIFLEGSTRAKSSSAYGSAVQYSETALNMLGENSWNDQYRLMLDLSLLLVESQYCIGNFAEAEKHYAPLLERCRTVADKSSVLSIQVQQFETQARFLDVLRVIRSCLQLHSIEIPDPMDSPQILHDGMMAERKRTVELFPEYSTKKERKEMIDESLLACARLLSCAWSPAYCWGNEAFMAMLCALAANFCMTHGDSEHTGLIFANLSFAWPDFRLGYRFGCYAHEISARYPNKATKARIDYAIDCGARNWYHPLSTTIPEFERLFMELVQLGDIPFACYDAHIIVSHRFIAGINIEECMKAWKRVEPFLRARNDFATMYTIGTSWTAFWHAKAEPITEIEIERNFAQIRNARGAYYCGHLQTLFWSHDHQWERVIPLLERAIDHRFSCHGHWNSQEFVFVVAMLHMASIREGALTGKLGQALRASEREKVWRERIREAFDNFTVLSETCPANAEHKMMLLRAEKSRMDGNDMEALQYYEKAKSSAHKYGFTQYECISNELAGRMMMEKGINYVGDLYIREAYVRWKEYGSLTKTQQLMSQFGKSLIGVNHLLPRHLSELSDEDSSMGIRSQEDLNLILTACETVSTDRGLEHYLEELMKLTLEGCNAQYGSLLLVNPQDSTELLIAAYGTTQEMKVYASGGEPLREDVIHGTNIVRYVARAAETVFIEDVVAHDDPLIDNQFRATGVRSVLCMPILRSSDCVGVFYLENSMISHAFTGSRKRSAVVIATQMISRIDDSRFSLLVESEKRHRELSSELSIVKRRLESFISTLCHELRNPLNGIFGCKQLMSSLIDHMRDQAQNAEVTGEEVHRNIVDLEDMVNTLSISADHLKDIVDTVLNVSKLNEDKVELQQQSYEVREVMHRVRVMFKSQIPTRVKLVVESPDLSRKLIGDPHRLAQILINFLSNACKFTSDGTITLCYRHESMGNNMTRVVIEVKDTGMGMTEEETSKIFSNFVQANKTIFGRFGGSGLGLSISKQLIELMGGKVTVTSKPGVGTTFHFYIICRNYEEETPKDDVSSEPSSKRRKIDSQQHVRLLIVEDDVINQKILTKMLSSHHYYDVEVVNNGAKAVDRFIATHKAGSTYHAIIMDSEMPVMGGQEATRRIRDFEESTGSEKRTRIIGVSANSLPVHRQQAMDNGMDQYITKPYQWADLLTAIEPVHIMASSKVLVTFLRIFPNSRAVCPALASTLRFTHFYEHETCSRTVTAAAINMQIIRGSGWCPCIWITNFFVVHIPVVGREVIHSQCTLNRKNRIIVLFLSPSYYTLLLLYFIYTSMPASVVRSSATILIKPPKPDNELGRLEALHNLKILDTEPEAVFDAITQMVQRHLDVPIDLISLVDSERQWFKSCNGLSVPGTSRDVAFCAYSILSADVFIVPNAEEDDRFKHNPLVTGGFAIGTLCVIDRKPRILPKESIAFLKDCASIVVQAMELREKNLKTEMQLLGEKTNLAIALRDRERLRHIIDAFNEGFIMWNTSHEVVMVNKAFSDITGITAERARTYHGIDVFSCIQTEQKTLRQLRRCLIDGTSDTFELVSQRMDGSFYWNRLCVQPVLNEKGSVVNYFGTFLDQSMQKATQIQLSRIKE